MLPCSLYQKSLAFRIYILVFAVILPFTILLGIIFLQRYQTRKDQAFATELEVSQGTSASVVAYLEGVKRTCFSLGRAINSLQAGGAVAETLLRDAAQDSGAIISYSWIGSSGSVRASSSADLVGGDIAATPLFQGLLSNESFLDDMVPGGPRRAPFFSYGVSFRDASGAFRGGVVARIDPSRLVEAMQIRKRPKRGSVAIFDSKGVLVLDSRFDQVAWESRVNWRKHDSVLAKSLASNRATYGVSKTTPGEKEVFIAVVIPIDATGWKLEARREYRSAMLPVRQGMLLDILFAAIATLAAFGLAFLLGRNITAPLFRLQRDAQLMSSGSGAAITDPYAPLEISELRAFILKLFNDLSSHAAELKESGSLLAEVFENVYDGIIIHDLQGRIVHVNQRWLTMFGLDRDAALGLTVADISAPPSKGDTIGAVWQEVLGGVPQLFEWNCRRPSDGSTFVAEVFLRSIRYRQEPMILGCVRDISDRKRLSLELQKYNDELEQRVRERTAELARAFATIQATTKQRLEAVEALRVKDHLFLQQSRQAAMGEMLGNIAHQWRQPLNNLALIVQEIAYSFRVGALSMDLLNQLEGNAMKVVKSMSQTIDDFSNLLGPSENIEVFSCKAVIEKVLSMIRPRAEVGLLADGEGYVKGVSNQFAHVIINILNNANDVLQERRVAHPWIKIRVFCQNDRLFVTIADNAGGIPAEVLPSIFDPYFTTKGPDRGTGIGLFMSKSIIEKMGGRLTVKNETEGAEFCIELEKAC